MAVLTIKRTFGPVGLSNTLTTNVYNNPSGLIYDILRQIHVVNVTNAAAWFSLYLGLTGVNTAGTELFIEKSIAAYDVYDWYCTLKMLTTDFLVGGASAASTLTITGMGEQYVV